MRGYSQEEALVRLRQHNWDIAQVMHAIDHEDSDHEHGSGEEV